MTNVNGRGLFRFALILVAVWFLTPRDAHAYLDAGTGTFLLQFIVSLFVGTFIIVKLYWSKLKALFAKLFGMSTSEKTTDDQ